jgi:glutamine synthetase adenylyltransferase
MTSLCRAGVRELLQRIADPHMAEQFGTPVDAAGAPQDLLVLAMGKAGGA